MEPPTTPDLLTPAGVRRLLDRHGLSPRKAAGQNFVVDPNTVRKIVRDADLDPGDRVFEVGPGLGSLTVALAAAVRRVVAVEIDAGLVVVLEDLFGDRDDVEIVHADALKVDLDALLGPGPVRMVSNLPYNVATPIVFRVLDCPAVSDLFVMVQREVGQRWAARPGDPAYGAVSVKLARLARVEIVATVPPTVFHPVPNVDSVTVRITREPVPATGTDDDHLVRVVDAAFGQRRKTLRNALRRVADADDLDVAFDRAGIHPGSRAEELDLDAFVRLAAALPDGATGG